MIAAKIVISGAGRGGGDSRFGYAESNENLVPYGLLNQTQVPEMASTIERLSGASAAGQVVQNANLMFGLPEPWGSAGHRFGRED